MVSIPAGSAVRPLSEEEEEQLERHTQRQNHRPDAPSQEGLDDDGFHLDDIEDVAATVQSFSQTTPPSPHQGVE